MFHSARLKLTLWYLAIISIITLSFSAIIYNAVTLELERGFAMAEYRVRGRPLPGQPTIVFLVDELKEAKRLVMLRLLIMDGLIVAVAGGVGYFLAGKTLHPIEVMIDEQKRFVADASHELKTPITALETSIEVTLRDKKLKLKDAKTTLKESLADIESLKKLTGDLLSLARYQQDHNFFKLEKVDVGEIVNEVKKIALPMAKKKGITLVAATEDFKANVSREGLEKLMTILLDNAIKYTRKNGKVTLNILKEGKHLKMTVKDNGIGISKEEQKHIFDRFYRVDEARGRNVSGGFGLGLSIAKQIVDLSHGTISVDSKPGKGSTFTIKLPS